MKRRSPGWFMMAPRVERSAGDSPTGNCSQEMAKNNNKKVRDLAVPRTSTSHHCPEIAAPAIPMINNTAPAICWARGIFLYCRVIKRAIRAADSAADDGTAMNASAMVSRPMAKYIQAERVMRSPITGLRDRGPDK